MRVAAAMGVMIVIGVQGSAGARGQDAPAQAPAPQPGVQPGVQPGTEPGVQPGTAPGVQPGTEPGVPRPARGPRREPGTGRTPEAPGGVGSAEMPQLPQPGAPGGPGWPGVPNMPGVPGAPGGPGGPGMPGMPMAPGLAQAAAPSASPEDVAWRFQQGRAVQAVIWGMPAVNMELVRRAVTTGTTAKVNELVLWSRPIDAMAQVLTPDPHVVTGMVLVNTKDAGPVVIEAPAGEGGIAVIGVIVDAWQTVLADIGADTTGAGGGGRFVVLPPGYSGPKPEGARVLASETFGGCVLLTSGLVSEEGWAKAVEVMKRVRVYPLSAGSGASAAGGACTDLSGVALDAAIPYDLRFFEALDRVVQAEPWLERDRVMLDQLDTVGINRGKPFAPGARAVRGLDEGAREAKLLLDYGYERGMPAHAPGSRWRLPSPAGLFDESSTPAGPGGGAAAYPIDARGLAYSWRSTGIERRGAGAFALTAISDGQGQPLQGAKSYRLRMPAGDGWSVTVYDRATHTLLKGAGRAGVSSTSAGLTRNEDGSVDVYFGAAPPAGKENAWVATLPLGTFEVMVRFYRPSAGVFDGSWRMPEIEAAP